MANIIKANRLIAETSDMLGKALGVSRMSIEDKMQLVASASPNRPVYLTLLNGTAGNFYGEIVGEKLKVEMAPSTFVLVRFAAIASAQMGA